jgi:hypothetical protein
MERLAFKAGLKIRRRYQESYSKSLKELQTLKNKETKTMKKKLKKAFMKAILSDRNDRCRYPHTPPESPAIDLTEEEVNFVQMLRRHDDRDLIITMLSEKRGLSTGLNAQERKAYDSVCSNTSKVLNTFKSLQEARQFAIGRTTNPRRANSYAATLDEPGKKKVIAYLAEWVPMKVQRKEITFPDYPPVSNDGDSIIEYC